MFPNKAPFYYQCKNCGHLFTSNKDLYAPSIFSSVSLDLKDFETDEYTIENNNKNSDSFPNKLFKKLLSYKYPKCPKCKENAVVSMDQIIHK